MKCGWGARSVGPKWGSGTSCWQMAAQELGQIVGFRVIGDEREIDSGAIRRVKPARTSLERLPGSATGSGVQADDNGKARLR